MRPGVALGNKTTRIFLAVLQESTPTVRSVGRSVGLSPMTVHHHLGKLREAGLVDWEPGRSGTLRALVRIVAAGVNRG